MSQLTEKEADEIFWSVFDSFFGEIYHCGSKIEYKEEDFKETEDGK